MVRIKYPRGTTVDEQESRISTNTRPAPYQYKDVVPAKIIEFTRCYRTLGRVQDEFYTYCWAGITRFMLLAGSWEMFLPWVGASGTSGARREDFSSEVHMYLGL